MANYPDAILLSLLLLSLRNTKQLMTIFLLFLLITKILYVTVILGKVYTLTGRNSLYSMTFSIC